MKKLMIAACAIALAGMAQAATYSWASSGYLYTWDSADPDWPVVSSGTAYLMFADAYSKASIVSEFQNSGTIASAKLIAAGLGGDITSDGQVNPSDAASDYTEAKEVYFVVLDDEHLFISGSVTAPYDALATSAISFKSGQVDDVWNAETYDAADGYVGDGWYEQSETPGPEPTPEPTSAMLMLLGMAGLALRRKQK